MGILTSDVPFPVVELDMRMHLKLYHGEYVGDVKDMAGLVACHDSSHEDAGKPIINPAYVHHNHVEPTEQSTEQEWNW